MTPVEQTILAPPLGNCYAACIASVLECSLDEVPQPREDKGGTPEGWEQYLTRLHEEFLYPRNLRTVFLDATTGYVPAGYSILGAVSSRGDWLHAVVAFDGEIVYDPHPLREMGVREWKDWTIFQVLDPSKM
jgi:hypothetical protein